MKTTIILLAAATLLWGCQKSSVSTHSPPPHDLEWYADQAHKQLLQKITNDIVGLNKIINLEENYVDSSPANWYAEVTAEYVNHWGGIDRTNLPYHCYLVPYTNFQSVVETDLVVMVDDEKVFKQTLEAIKRGAD